MKYLQYQQGITSSLYQSVRDHFDDFHGPHPNQADYMQVNRLLSVPARLFRHHVWVQYAGRWKETSLGIGHSTPTQMLLSQVPQHSALFLGLEMKNPYANLTENPIIPLNITRSTGGGHIVSYPFQDIFVNTEGSSTTYVARRFHQLFLFSWFATQNLNYSNIVRTISASLIENSRESFCWNN